MLALAATSQNHIPFFVPLLILFAAFVLYNIFVSPKVIFSKKIKGKEVIITVKNKLKKPLKNLEIRDLVKGNTQGNVSERRQTIFGDLLIWKKDQLSPNEEWTVFYLSNISEDGIAEFDAICDGKIIHLTS